MNDLYKEILVTPKPDPKSGLLKAALIVVTVLLAAFSLLFQPLLLAVAAILVLLEVYLIFPRLKVEYEYLYVNGDIDIDAIYNKSSRKKKGSYDNASLEVMAPTGSAHLDGFVNRQGTKVLDYSSGEPGRKTWTLVYGGDSGRKQLILELTDEIAQDMRRYSPQKVFFQ